MGDKSVFQFVLTLVSSAGVSTILATALLFLYRTWISERLKNAIRYEYEIQKAAVAHEHMMLLETHKAELTAQHQTALEELRVRSTYEIERVRHAQQAEMERFRTLLQIEVASDERIRAEIVKWANPIFGAVSSLEGRLENIINNHGYLALKPGFAQPGWSVTHDYFMQSTLFAFSEYFCWVRMLEERMSFEMFRSQEQKNAVFRAFAEVAAALRSFPPPFDCDGDDAQVFIFQQRAIGEMMMREIGGRPACLPYHEFEMKFQEVEVAARIAPLKSLLENLSPQSDCRWKRVSLTLTKLHDLGLVCRELLRLE